MTSTDHDFGTVNVGASDTVTVTIRNDDTVNDLVIDRLDFDPASPDCTDVSITSPANTPPPPINNITVPPGMTTDVVIAFAPLSTITLNCSLRIGSDDPSSPDLVTLTGTTAASELQVSMTDLDFGPVKTSAGPASAMFVIENVGTGASFTINTILITGDAEFSLNPPYVDDSVTLAPTETHTVIVEFDPDTQNSFTGTVSITSDAVVNPNDSVGLLGDGVQAIISVDPDPVNFTDTRVSTDNDVIVDIDNTGDADLNISLIALSGGQAGNFSIQGATPSTVAAGGSEPITVRCTPLTAGNKTALLEITSDDDDGNDFVAVALNCRGTDPPEVTVNPLALNFMGVPVGNTPQLMVTVSNAGGGNREDLIVNAPVISGGEFSVSPNTAFTVPPGMMQVVIVTFAPTTIGDQSETLTITSNDPDAGDATQVVPLDGTGQAAEITEVQPGGGAIDFGIVPVSTTSAAETIQIRNDGNVNLDISNVQLVGGDAGSFRIASGPTSSTVTPTNTETWTVVCEPLLADALENLSATFRVTSNALGGDFDVSLACEGGDIDLQVIPDTLSFGPIFVGTSSPAQSVTLRNDGNLPVDITGFTFSNADFAFGTAPPATPFTLSGGGDSTTFTVVFSPQTEQVYTGESLTIVTSGGMFSVALDGQGVQSEVVFDPPSPYAFGDVRVGNTQTLSVTMTNNGSGAFQVSSIAPADTTNFAIQNINPALPTTLAEAGGSLTFEIVARPQIKQDNISSDITVVTNIPGQETITLLASVNGTAPGIDANPGTIDFGPVDEQAGPAQRSLTITNDGTATLNISDIAITGPDAALFALAAGSPTSAVVTAGNTIDLTVEFDPEVEAAVQAGTQLEFISDAFNEANIAVTLTGRGIDRRINLSAMQIDFPDTYRNPIEATTRSLQIQNLGEAPLRVMMFMRGGMDRDAFRVEQDMPMTIGPMATESVDIAFDPSALGGFTSALTIVNDDDNDPMAVVQLRGNSVLRDVAVAPMQTINFGRVPVGQVVTATFPITVSNLNAVDTYQLLDVRATDMAGEELTGGPFAIANFNPGPIGPMSQVTVDVTFAPDQIGDAEARIQLVLDVADEKVDAMVMLVGEGVGTKVRGGGCQVGGSSGTGAGLLLVLCFLAIARRSRRRTSPRRRR